MDWLFPSSSSLVNAGLLSVGACAFLTHLVLVNGRRLFASPGTLFLGAQLMFWIGTAAAVDPARRSDVLWFATVSGGLFCFVLGEATANRWKRFHPRQEIPSFTSAPVVYDLNSRVVSFGIKATILVSCAVGVVYARAVGYNVFFGAAKVFLTFGTLDPVSYSTLRVSISGDNYVASGYGAQFIAILLPALLCLVYLVNTREKRTLGRILFALLCVGDIWFMTIGGGRTWLVLAVLSFLALISPFGPLPILWPANRKLSYVILFLLLGYYALSATLMGRAGETSGSVGSIVRGGAAEFYERTMGSEAGFHMELMEYYLYKEPTMGAQWWRDLKEVLPGRHKASTSGVEMYALLHNGDVSGSMGLTIWGSFVYNWGLRAAFLLSLVTGFAFQRLTISYVRGPRTLLRVTLLFLAGFRLIFVRDPYSLLLHGFFTLTAFYLLLHWIERPVRYAQAIPDRIAGRHWGMHARSPDFRNPYVGK